MGLSLTIFHRTLKVMLNLFKTADLIHTSLDDEMPDISELLRRYPRPRASAESSATTSNAPIILSRPSLRSNTFDGKSVFLRRKSRTIGAPVRVPKHNTGAES